MIDLQALFNRIVVGVFKQGKRSEVSESDTGLLGAAKPVGTCIYWNKVTNCKCGVGQVIPEDLYDPQMDAVIMGVTEILSKYPKLAEYWGLTAYCDYMSPNRNMLTAFLIEIQHAHDVKDHWESEHKLREAFHDVAEEFHLSVGVLNHARLGMEFAA